MRKWGRESRTAVCSSTGILTRPNANEPFHNARDMNRSACKSQTPNPTRQIPTKSQLLRNWELGFGMWVWDLLISARTQLALGFHPIVEVLAVAAAAAQVAVIRGFGNLVVGGVVIPAWRGCASGGGGTIGSRI